MATEINILLLMSDSCAGDRDCLCGIARFAHSQADWVLHHEPGARTTQAIAHAIGRVQPAGIIGRAEIARPVKRPDGTMLPLVTLAGGPDAAGHVVVQSDHKQMVALACEHLLANGFLELAYCGRSGDDDSAARQAAFLSQPAGPRVGKHVDERPQGAPGDRDDLARLRAWLTSLPRPLGVLACDDLRARNVLGACAAAGLRVPADVAVVGVNNDEVVCELARPAITSVIPNFDGMGFRAAKALRDLLGGQPIDTRQILVAPVGIEVRASSDVETLSDPVMLQAVRYIRNSVAQGVSVKDIIAHVGVSRSTLDRRFLEQLGCTPHDYIVARQVEMIRRLLLETTYSVRQISAMTGFRSPAHMVAVFKSHTRMTPGQFRQDAG